LVSSCASARVPMATDEWKEETLRVHNDLRARHGAPPLTWSDECYEQATLQAAAWGSGASGPHGHMEGASGKHGQNTYMSDPAPTATQAAEWWYSELRDPGYDFASPGLQGGASHFTQLVWVATEHVGMATSPDGSKIVANYLPQGNFCMPGYFEKNVLPLDSAMATRDAPTGTGGAGAEGTVTASEMTPELEALFEGCPIPAMKEQVVQAIAGGGQVTVTRTGNSISWSSGGAYSGAGNASW